ncbi:YaiI/YqxD family protein [Telmatospirillum sp.]|uniref:YaiI/YqxD family protein n=1 Tax=Telmatospirillum sp. TaxID=2079197 RepID=UPI00283DD377|nr:YaiI/YqxD family protein [Telmatospirillum sp.]MDR3441251.1 YaiI/YqxD family protein [Telmatospirillum sp.]
MRLFVDADACPVKDEVLRVALRHDLPIVFSGNSWMRGFDHPLVEQVVAAVGLNSADDCIVERIEPGDIVVTADVPLAARCLEKGARGIDPRGKAFDDASIGMAVAVRDLMTDLRDTGIIEGGGPSSYSKQDRSRFLDGLERLIQSMKRS